MKFRSLIPAIVLASVARGQSPAVTNTPPFSAIHGAFFALSVSDIDASAQWYAEKFGLHVDLRDIAAGHGVVILSGNGLNVELIHTDKATPLGRDAQLAHGAVKVGFVVDDLPKTLAALRSRGVVPTAGPWPPKPEQNILANVIISDNAGNVIQIFGR